MNSRFKSTGGKEIEEKCPVRIYVISITYILRGRTYIGVLLTSGMGYFLMLFKCVW